MLDLQRLGYAADWAVRLHTERQSSAAASGDHKNVRRLNMGGVARQKGDETQTSSEGEASFCAFPATFHGRLLALARLADDNPGGAGPLRHLKGSGSGVGLVSSDRFDRRSHRRI